MFIFFSTVESDILNKSGVETIGHWLKESNKLGTYKPCMEYYKDYLINMKECDDKKNYIFIAQLNFTIIGGFTSGDYLEILFFPRSFYRAQCFEFPRINSFLKM